MLLSGCAAIPVAIVAGGGATIASRDKGVSGTISDSSITTSIGRKLYEFHSKAFTQIDTDVQMGEVLLTGIVDDPSYAKKAEEIAWKVDGVQKVYNHIESSGSASFLDYSKDTWITTKVKTNFLNDTNINSLNYFVKTIGGTVYLMGSAKDERELRIVHAVATKTTGVKKIISYIKVKDIES